MLSYACYFLRSHTEMCKHITTLSDVGTEEKHWLGKPDIDSSTALSSLSQLATFKMFWKSTIFLVFSLTSRLCHLTEMASTSIVFSNHVCSSCTCAQVSPCNHQVLLCKMNLLNRVHALVNSTPWRLGRQCLS